MFCAQQLAQGRRDKLQLSHDQLLVHGRAKAEAGNRNAQEREGKEGKEGIVGNRCGYDPCFRPEGSLGCAGQHP